MVSDVLKYLPEEVAEEVKICGNEIEEIRLRVNKKVCLKMGQDIKFLNTTINKNDIKTTFERMCENSVYSYINQVSNGFITIDGGNRVGLVGNCVIENGKVININYISSLNFRIAREIKDVAIPFLKEVIDIKNNTIFTTLIVSPPGGGKTTVLRDLIRIVSNGMPEIGFKAKTCGVVDERGEIAASYKGIPQNDLGELTDVIENVPKDIGMKILIRSMAPEIIACDEIGTQEDYNAIKYAVNSGVKGIFTYHAKNIDEVMRNVKIKELANDNVIEKIIVLDMEKKGQIKEVR